MSAAGISFVASPSLALVLALVTAHSRVHVVTDGETGRALAAALAKEPDLIVGTASSAEVIVSLTPSAGAMVLVVREANGATALERRIDLDRGIDPAMRMAVLLVRGALEPSEEAPPSFTFRSIAAPLSRSVSLVEPPIAISEATPFALGQPPKVWGAEFSAAMIGDLDPAVMVVAHRKFGAFELGLGGLYSFGLGGERHTESISGKIADSIAFFDLSWTFAELDRASFRVFGSAGVDLVRFEAGAVVPTFAGEGTRDVQRSPVPVFFAGARAGWAFSDTFSLELRAGARVLPQRVERGVPADFVGTPLKTDILGLFVSAGAAFEIL